MAEAAVLSRHLRALWGLPGTALAVVGWPPTRRERFFLTWHYWWQAHLIDCAVDAAIRVPTPARRRRIAAIVRGHRIRNLTGWTNRYYDDMAWLALALERVLRIQGADAARGGLGPLERALYHAWAPAQGGGIPWRVGADFYNAPANGPAGIALARLGRRERAVEMADWIDETLRDPDTGLIFDGIHLPSGVVERPIYSYCQGVVLGLETELAVRTGEPRHADRVHRLLHAVEEHLTVDGVVRGGGGGDGGLFNGILIRYLAQVALMLPGDGHDRVGDRRIAARIVLESAAAAWANRLEVDGEPLFGHDWSRPATLPTGSAGAGELSPGGSVTSSRSPARDLSVQLSGWMLMEAAQLVDAAGL
ncbi:glycoside hydrolase family 76 protein [Nocardia paucivorans]|uniref:glycoside hydrolase family 76 protein n=1 Tax=Nocardia paucivorans TaxID=114259 RepID=UPI000592EF41|nr:glycoside hydrolase family 76 protein [Nocardia paucivorans]